MPDFFADTFVKCKYIYLFIFNRNFDKNEFSCYLYFLSYKNFEIK